MIAAGAVELRVLTSPSRAVLEAIGRARVDIWSEQAPQVRTLFPNGVWLDAHDEHAHHVVLFDGNDVLAASRVCVHSALQAIHADLASTAPRAPHAYISRLVVSASLRGSGAARRLDAERTRVAREHACRSMVVCWSSLSGEERLAALRAQGFSEFGDASDTPFSSDERFRWLHRLLH